MAYDALASLGARSLWIKSRSGFQGLIRHDPGRAREGMLFKDHARSMLAQMPGPAAPGKRFEMDHISDAPANLTAGEPADGGNATAIALAAIGVRIREARLSRNMTLQAVADATGPRP